VGYNPFLLRASVDQRLFAIGNSGRDKAEKTSAINQLFGELEGALHLAIANRDDETAERTQFKLEYLRKQVGNMR
jgi:hypothetical protein